MSKAKLIFIIKRVIVWAGVLIPISFLLTMFNSSDDLKACITECSFPNRMQDVADISLHLSPKTLASEIKKLKKKVPVYLYHFKPPYVDELRKEVKKTKFVHKVLELEQDRTYTF